tara:strand:+ start:13459 stop:13989 length:531 start_codon:yes stop_codon:yes gene_type:complete
MKPVLMLHEFKEEFLDLPLENYILTFDDGLYTQYKFLDNIKKIKTKKYFFISSGIVCPEYIDQNNEYISCVEAHNKAFKGNFSNYMKWSQINEINQIENCFIGCHSHYHKLKTADCVECIIDDNKQMSFEFIKNLDFIPDNFCFPYNYETPLYREILNLKGFKNFYGSERIDISEI